MCKTKVELCAQCVVLLQKYGNGPKNRFST